MNPKLKTERLCHMSPGKTEGGLTPRYVRLAIGINHLVVSHCNAVNIVSTM